MQILEKSSSFKSLHCQAAELWTRVKEKSRNMNSMMAMGEPRLNWWVTSVPNPLKWTEGLSRWLRCKEFAYQFRRHRCSPWVRKIPWRRKWQPAPVFLPGKCQGQRRLAGCSPWGLEESETTEGLTRHLRKEIEVGLVTRLGKEGIWPEEIWRKQEDKFSSLRVCSSHPDLLSSFELPLTVLPLLKWWHFST